MALTHAKVSNAKVPEGQKLLRLSDGHGLYLLVKPDGKKYWRYDYRFNGKRKTASLGTFPEVGIREARDKLNDFRSQLRQGRDPIQKKAISKANDFQSIALEWLNKRKEVLTEKHARTVLFRLERYLFPFIGLMEMDQIDAPTLLHMLERIEHTGKIETTHRIKSLCGQVFRYAIVTGRATRDPSADLRGALARKRPVNMPTILDKDKIGELIRAIRGYEGEFTVQIALQMAPYVFVRPGELRKAEWSEIDLDEVMWRIPAEKMKMRRTHIVPLSRQVVSLLKKIHPLTGQDRYIFSSLRNRDRPLSENTLNAALRRLGYSKDELVAHGFRAMASTLLHEMGWQSDVIERQLAHAERNAVKGAYNHALYMPERIKMMQVWADHLDELADTIKRR